MVDSMNAAQPPTGLDLFTAAYWVMFPPRSLRIPLRPSSAAGVRRRLVSTVFPGRRPIFPLGLTANLGSSLPLFPDAAYAAWAEPSVNPGLGDLLCPPTPWDRMIHRGLGRQRQPWRDRVAVACVRQWRQELEGTAVPWATPVKEYPQHVVGRAIHRVRGTADWVLVDDLLGRVALTYRDVAIEVHQHLQRLVARVPFHPHRLRPYIGVVAWHAAQRARDDEQTAAVQDRGAMEECAFLVARDTAERHDHAAWRDRLDEALAHLPAQERQIIELRVKDQLTWKDCGQVLGITPRGARKRWHVALGALRRALRTIMPA
jgi:RNA polymerase sigma factor (sigma-70 family)